MKDKLIAWIEENRKKFFVLVAVVIIFFLIIGSAVSNAIKDKKREKQAQQPPVETQEIESSEIVDIEPSSTPAPIEQDKENDEPTDSSYKSSLGLDKDKDKDGRVELETPTPPPIIYETEILTAPKYPIATKIFGHTVVPTKNVDGSSFSTYLKGVKYDSFSTKWGLPLNELDFIGGEKYYVGVEQQTDEQDALVSLESLGWLIDNLDKLQPNDVIRFANLHMIKNLSDDHIAMLCSYDWYSAFGMKNTLVFFEDISNTLKVEDFTDGDIFSTMAFVHNIKIEENINKQLVVNVQYTTYPEDLVVQNPAQYLAKGNIEWIGPTNFYAEDNTSDFEIYWYYKEDGSVVTHILYPNGRYSDETVKEIRIKNSDGTFDIQLIYKDKGEETSVRTTLLRR